MHSTKKYRIGSISDRLYSSSADSLLSVLMTHPTKLFCIASIVDIVLWKAEKYARRLYLIHDSKIALCAMTVGFRSPALLNFPITISEARSSVISCEARVREVSNGLRM